MHSSVNTVKKLKQLIIVFLVLFSVDGWAAVYTVKTAGGNFSSISSCAGTAVAGDTCEVYAGSWAGWTQYKNGSSGNPITFKAHAGDTVNITSNITVNGRSYVTIQDFSSITGAINGDGSTNHIIIQNNHFTGTMVWKIMDGLGSNGADNVFRSNVVNMNTFRGPSRDSAVYVYGDRNLFENNEIYNGAGDCFELGGKNVVVRGNYCHDLDASVSGEHIDFVQVVGGGTTPTLQFSLVEKNIEKDCANSQCHFAIFRQCSGEVDCTLVGDGIVLRYNYVHNLTGSGISFGGVGDNAPNGQAYNNTFATEALDGENGAGVSCDNAPNGRILNSIFYKTSGNSWSPVSCAFGNGNIAFNPGYLGSWNSPYSTEATYNSLKNRDPLFANYPADGTILSTSPAKHAGVPLTTTNGAGSSSTALVVNQVYPFQDGWAGVNADCIAVGTVSNSACISSINYSTSTLTLTTPLTWGNGASVWLYKRSDGTVVFDGSAPDVGAYEGTPPVPGNSGTITTSNVGTTSLTLNWTKATDNFTPQSGLQYEVLLSVNSGGTPDNTQVIQTFTADIATFTATGLASGTAYFFNVIVKDAEGNKTVYVMKGETTLGFSVSPATLPAGAVGLPYIQVITAPGALGPNTFSISTGALPAGLTLNALTGVISGTPVSMGTTNFTVKVLDSLGNEGQRPYSLTSATDDSNNIVLVRKGVSYDSAPTPGFVGTFTITVSIQNFGSDLGGPVFFKVIELDKIAPDLNPAQPDKLLTADNGPGVTGDIQSLPLSGFPTTASTDVTFQIGLGSRQQFTFIADLFGLFGGSPITADEAKINVKADAGSPIGPRLLKRFTFQVPESVSPLMSGEPESSAIPPASNMAVITGPGSRSRSAVAIDPILPRRMAVAANDTAGSVIVSTTEDGGSTWHATMMSRSLGDLSFFNAQDASLAFDWLGRLSVVYVVSNINDAANATVITESTDGVNFNPPLAISFHGAEENVIDSRPMIAIGAGGRYVAWENFGSNINVVRSEPGGIFGPAVTVVSGAPVSSPTIAIGGKAVYIGWDEWGFNSRPPYTTGGRLMMASSPHGEQLKFSDPLQIAPTSIGFSSPRIPMLSAPRGVATNLNLAVDPRRENLLYGAFVDKQNGLGIRFARSLDDGRTWAVTALNNCAGGGDQFSPAMSLDSDGNVYISFYDTLRKQAKTAHMFLARSSTANSFGRQQASDGCLAKSAPAQFVFNSPAQFVFDYRTPSANWFKTPSGSWFKYEQITTAPIDESRTNLGSGMATNLGDRTAIAIGSESILVAWTDTRQKKEELYLSILPVRP